MALDLKKQLEAQAAQLLFDASKGTAAKVAAVGESIASMFQNGIENVPAADFAEAKALVEASLAEALDTFGEILQAGIDLKAGKLPS